MDKEAVALAALPSGLRAPQPAARPGRRTDAGGRRKRLPRATTGGAAGEADAAGGADDRQGDARRGGRPQGPIAIADLFAPGIYEGRVQTWLAAADAA
eukprot:3878122-Pleurochrysis_carterae.AAC.1